jgi:ADP-ribose pyrophosphatase
MDFETVQSTPTYRGTAFNVRRDRIRLPNGHLTEVDIVDHPSAVTMLPIDEGGRVWFVRQYRHAAGTHILELPAGTLHSGESTEACAGRELREEIGMAAGELLKLGEFFLAPGYSTEYMHVYLATGLRPDPLQGDEDEFLAVETIPLAEIDALVRSGAILDGKTLATIYLAMPHLMAFDRND